MFVSSVCLRVFVCVDVIVVIICFFFSSRRRHTRCALVTGVQTCALPICHSVGLLCAGQESWMGSPTWLLQRTSPVKACSGDQTPNVAARRGSVTKRSRCFHPRDSLLRRHGWTASRDRTPDIRVRSPSAHFEDQAKTP